MGRTHGFDLTMSVGGGGGGFLEYQKVTYMTWSHVQVDGQGRRQVVTLTSLTADDEVRRPDFQGTMTIHKDKLCIAVH